MNLRQRFPARHWGRQLGWPGVIGLAGLVTCLAFYFSTVRPSQQRLDTLRTSAGSLHERIAHAGLELDESARPVDEQLAAFYRIFPGEHEAADWIGKIAAIAQRGGFSLQEVEYRVNRDKAGKLTRYQMNLPLSGEYQKIRRFLSDLGTEIPIVSLEQVQFERQKVGDRLVDAKIRLVIFLGRAS